MSSSAANDILTCYVFKSRLQEYAQKAGLPTPVYYTTKQGPPHNPSFNSSVEVGGLHYNSLPDFPTRKAAEQSASEVAITSLLQSGQLDHSFSQSVQEIGLCKNILQEYAQKMNYAVPAYSCQRNGSTRPTWTYSCMLEMGGVRYLGAVAKTKKEAEIKAARTALLTLQSTTGVALGGPVGHDTDPTRLTVLPWKRKAVEPAVKTPKKKWKKNKTWPRRENISAEGMGAPEYSSEMVQTHFQEAAHGPDPTQPPFSLPY